MLRWIVLALLVANAGFYAWSQGYLTGRTPNQGDPERLKQQVRPDAITLAPPSEKAASGTASAKSAPSAPSP